MNGRDFEKVTCGRCGGCGRYSFNYMDLDKCYGCNGTGEKYTKRGYAAKLYFESLLSRPLCLVKVGDAVRLAGQSKFHKVVKVGLCTTVGTVEPDGTVSYKKWEIVLAGGYGYVPLTWNAPVRLACADKTGIMDLALAYQATLTKSGMPAKRAS